MNERLIPINEFKRPGKKIKVEYITIHSTDSPLETDYARIADTSNHQKDAWHIGIGEDDIIKAIPLDEFTFHAQAANDTSLAVMISMHIKSYKDSADLAAQREALLNKAADTIAKLMAGFGFTISRLKAHQDWNEDKKCPILHVMSFNGLKGLVEKRMPSYSLDPELKQTSVGNEIEIAYDKTRALLSSSNVTSDANKEIRCIVIQQTTKQSAFTAYSTIESDDEDDVNPPKAAHFVIDADNVVKYIPSSSNVFDATTRWTDKAMRITQSEEEDEQTLEDKAVELVQAEVDETSSVKNKKDLTSPANYCLCIDLCIDDKNDYPSVEINLIRFLVYYLNKHGLDTYNVWRAYDLVENFKSPEIYKDSRDYTSLINEVKACLSNPKREPQNIIRVIDPEWSSDRRHITKVSNSVKITDISMMDEDFEAVTIGGNVFRHSRFSQEELAQEFVQMQTNLYEPVYPDLTVPPRAATSLYNIGIKSPLEILEELDYREKNDDDKLFEMQKEMDDIETTQITEEEQNNIPLGKNLKQKPVIGKIPNIFDPYPVDRKVAQLQMHAPMVTLEYEDASKIQQDTQFYIINRFINTEKRLVALENMLSANMRMLHRMAARVNINCVYYGGQSVYDKYKCIRCLSDDLTNDAACVTLEQCLNCSRYEPIEGQVYEFMSKEAGPGKANVFDDVQASYMTKEDYAELNRIEQENIEDTRPYIDLTKTHIRLQNDHLYDDLLAGANNFVMNWDNTELKKQSPHVNIYEYDFSKISLDKSRLDPSNKYEDGWREVEQNKYRRPDYGIHTLGGGGFGGNVYGNSSVGVFYSLDDYDVDTNDMRIAILDYANRACVLGSKNGFQYTLGAKIIERHLTPEELVTKAKAGEEVSNFTLGKDADDDELAVYTDCSNFTNYIYYLASGGKLDIAGDTLSLMSSPDFEHIGSGEKVLNALKLAIPGDLILYRKQDNTGHVSIYAGYDDCYEAYGNASDKTKQILKNKVKDRSDFYAILRHKDLSVPKLKNKQFIDISLSSAEFVRKYELVEKRNTLDGNDSNYTTDFDKIHQYVRVDDKMDNEKILQFIRIDSTLPEDLVTAEVLAKYLRNVAPNVDRTSSMPNPAAFIEAQRQSGINALFLLVHCAQETGWGTSNWMNGGGKYKSSDGRPLYNAYGLLCYNNDSQRKSATQKAEAEGWFTKEAAVIGGAKFIAQQYLSQEQVAKHGIRNTPYFMKWHMGSAIEGNAGNPGSMQYSTDISWANQRASMMFRALSNVEGGINAIMPHLKFDIPRFKDPGMN